MTLYDVRARLQNYLIYNLNFYEDDGNSIGYYFSNYGEYISAKFIHKVYDMNGHQDYTSPNKFNIYPSNPEWEIGIRPVIEIYK